MRESTRTRLFGTARALVALACVTVVVTARTTVGWANLLAMLAGMAGLLALLAAYNRRFR